MLSIIEYGKDEYEFPALIVLGCFDAIHSGHRELLKKAKLQAKINGLDLGVMMFREGKSGKLVYSFEERCALLEQFNVKFVLAVDFNEQFKAVAPLDFLNQVEDKINVKAYMSGKDFRFGAQAKGKSSTLKNYAEDEENGVWYMPVKDVVSDGDKVSTTLIKSCIQNGDIEKANRLLGSEFFVSGEVVKGEGRGTAVVGFPTVNIEYPEWKCPLKYGVYGIKCLIGETDYNGIANFGNCPTFGDDRIALEVYLEGFSGDLYGRTLTIRFLEFIREIEEFASAEELSGQLKNDLKTVSDEVVAADSEGQEQTEEERAVTEAEISEEIEQPAQSDETATEKTELVEEKAEGAAEDKTEEEICIAPSADYIVESHHVEETIVTEDEAVSYGEYTAVLDEDMSAEVLDTADDGLDDIMSEEDKAACEEIAAAEEFTETEESAYDERCRTEEQGGVSGEPAEGKIADEQTVILESAEAELSENDNVYENPESGESLGEEAVENVENATCEFRDESVYEGMLYSEGESVGANFAETQLTGTESESIIAQKDNDGLEQLQIPQQDGEPLVEDNQMQTEDNQDCATCNDAESNKGGADTENEDGELN